MPQFVDYNSHRPPAWIFCDRIYLHCFRFVHISDVKQMSDMRHEHSDERKATKSVCLVHSIQMTPTKANNEL